MKQNKTITVFEDDCSWGLPEKAADFMDFWLAKLDEIPNEYRDSARIEVEAEPSYDGSACLSISVTYTRPETDQEKRNCKYWKNEELVFSVIAGKFDDDTNMNCKYASDFSSLDQAIKAYDEMNGYPWRYIQYAGRLIDVYPKDFNLFG